MGVTKKGEESLLELEHTLGHFQRMYWFDPEPKGPKTSGLGAPASAGGPGRGGLGASALRGLEVLAGALDPALPLRHRLSDRLWLSWRRLGPGAGGVREVWRARLAILRSFGS